MDVQVIASVALCDPLVEPDLVRDHCGLVGVALTEGDRLPVRTDMQGVAEDARLAPWDQAPTLTARTRGTVATPARPRKVSRRDRLCRRQARVSGASGDQGRERLRSSGRHHHRTAMRGVGWVALFWHRHTASLRSGKSRGSGEEFLLKSNVKRIELGRNVSRPRRPSSWKTP